MFVCLVGWLVGWLVGCLFVFLGSMSDSPWRGRRSELEGSALDDKTYAFGLCKFVTTSSPATIRQPARGSLLTRTGARSAPRCIGSRRPAPYHRAAPAWGLLSSWAQSVDSAHSSLTISILLLPPRLSCVCKAWPPMRAQTTRSATAIYIYIYIACGVPNGRKNNMA